MNEYLKPFMMFVIMGITVESIVETIKQVKKGKKIDINVVLALIVGQVLAFTFRLDVYSVFGIQAFIPYVTMVITGILISRGGNFVYDLWDRFNGKDKEAKE